MMFLVFLIVVFILYKIINKDNNKFTNYHEVKTPPTFKTLEYEERIKSLCIYMINFFDEVILSVFKEYGKDSPDITILTMFAVNLAKDDKLQNKSKYAQIYSLPEDLVEKIILDMSHKSFNKFFK